MPSWKNILKLARGSDDTVSAMFDEIIKIKPELKGALTYIKNEYKLGNISGEAANRAANMTERAARAERGGTVADRSGVKILGDYGTTRKAAREAMDESTFDAIDERIKDFDLKGNTAVDPKTRSIRNRQAEDAEKVDTDYKTYDDAGIDTFKKAFDDIRERYLGGSSRDNLERGWRRSKAGLEGNVVEDFENARKSGLSMQEAAEEVARNSGEKYGYELDFNDVIESVRNAHNID